MRNDFSYVSQSSEMQEYIVTAEFISNLTAFSATSYDLYIDHCNHIRIESPFFLWEMFFSYVSHSSEMQKYTDRWIYLQPYRVFRHIPD